MPNRPATGLLCLAVLLVAGGCGDTTPSVDTGGPTGRTVGVLLDTPAAAPGYTLFAPMNSMEVWLVDREGRVVHSWTTNTLGYSVYLLADGSILRSARIDNPVFTAGGSGGRIQRYGWDGTLLWDYVHSTVDFHHHHDIEPLPNGNVLVVEWDRRSMAEAIQAGREPARLTDGELHPDAIVELEPNGLNGANVVWRWNAWDHLVQDHDMTKDGFGVVADHPELIDVNAGLDAAADWMHVNAVHYNATLDQVLLCVHHFGEIWVIDHGTTTMEAAGHTGGAQGKGGDLLWRWGNAASYDHGGAADQQLFGQHDARWIADGISDVLVFNNGQGRPGGDFSSVDQIMPPADIGGGYTRMPGAPFGPNGPSSSYVAPVPTDFFARIVSGAERLAGSNTLICDGPQGRFFEVTSTGALAWDYINPDIGSGTPLEFDQEVPVGPAGRRNIVFRATRIPPGHPGLVGHDLTPGDTIETGP
jgi:hypothetical protein